MSGNITAEQLTALFLKFKEPLAEIDARLFEQAQGTYVSLLGDAELPRHWPELSPDSIPDAIDYLNIVTSVKNSTPLKYVDDPMANQEVYRGRWRQAFVRRVMQGEVTKLVQVLRRGWAETINWDEARVRTGRFLQDQPTGANTSDYERYLEVSWPNCSISKLNAMVASLNEREYVDPILENETRTGTWRNLGVTTTKSDDGSGIITMSLAISHFRLDAFTNWLTNHNEDVTYLYGYSKDEAQAVIEAWKSKGHGATVSYRKDEGLVDLVLRSRDFTQTDILNQPSSWDCRYKTFIDYHFGVSDPELYQLTTTPANGISYDRQLRDNGDGSWDILIITREVQYRDIPFQVSKISGDSSVETRQQLGLTTQTPEPMVSTAGVIKRQVCEVKDDCSKDVVTDKDTGVAQTATTKIVSPSGTVTIEEKTVQTAQLPDPSSSKGHIKTVVNKESKYPERFETTEKDDEPDDQTAVSVDNSPSQVATKTLHTENPTNLTTPAVVKGKITTQEAQPTQAGNQRTIVTETVPEDQVEISYADNAFEKTQSTLHTENPIALGLPAHEVGKVKENHNVPTAAGNTKTVESEGEAQEQVVSYSAVISDKETTEVEKGHNVETLPVIVAVDGADVLLDGDMNDHERYDYIKRIVTSYAPLSCPGIVSWAIEGSLYKVPVGLTYNSTENRYYASGYQTWRITIFHGFAYYKTAALAAAALPTIAVAIGGLLVDPGSDIGPSGANLWIAVVQSRNDQYVSATNFGNPQVWP